MKNLFFALLVLLGATSVQAQKVQSQFGEELKFKGGIDYSSPIALLGNKLYARAIKPKFMSPYPYSYITVIDAKTLKVISTEEMVLPNKKADVISIIMAKGQKWAITRNTDKKTKVDIVEAYQINAQGKIMPKAFPMASFIDKKGGSLFSFSTYEASSTVVFSPDSSKIGLLINANLKKKENELFYVKVFNTKDMSQVWEQVVTLPYSEKRYELRSTVVNDKGEVMFTGKLYNDEKARNSKSKTEAAYKYVLHNFDGKTPAGNEFLLDLNGKFIESSFVIVRPDNGNTVAAGFYGNERASAGIFGGDGGAGGEVVNGVYYIEIEKGTNKVVNQFMTDVPGDKIKYVSRAVHNKKKNGLEGYTHIKDVYFKKNGSMIIVASTYHITVTTDSRGRTQTYYHDYDAPILSFTQKGDLEWGTSAAKFVTTQAAAIVGTETFFKDDNVFILYNDDIKNAERTLDKEPSGLGVFDKACVMLAKIDGSGKLDRKVLVTKKELDGYWFAPGECIRVGTSEFVFSAVKIGLLGGRDYKIGRIKLGE
jgi:hypothetical protein